MFHVANTGYIHPVTPAEFASAIKLDNIEYLENCFWTREEATRLVLSRATYNAYTLERQAEEAQRQAKQAASDLELLQGPK